MHTKPQPRRLGKGQHPDFLDEQFTITGKQLVLIFLLACLFVAFCIVMQPQTYGMINW